MAMETTGIKRGGLLLTDLVAVPDTVAIKGAVDEATARDDMLVITQAALLREKLPIESASMEVVLCVSKTPQLLAAQWLEEMSRVLKPGGKIIIQTPVPLTEQSDKPRSTVERKLLTTGFIEIQAIETRDFSLIEGIPCLTIKGKKASWTIGSSFSIRRTTKAIPKIQIDDESDLIDEDSLLTEEDLKKPQLTPVGDCEVGSTRKACKNCTCGRTDAEERALKIGLTVEQIDNPQSACGSCGLGDAFRCGRCPYKGLPPFKLGEKVSLTGNFLTAEI